MLLWKKYYAKCFQRYCEVSKYWSWITELIAMVCKTWVQPARQKPGEQTYLIAEDFIL
jgi:hypothetical protein